MKLESGLNAYFTRVLKQSEEKGGGNMTTAPTQKAGVRVPKTVLWLNKH